MDYCWLRSGNRDSTPRWAWMLWTGRVPQRSAERALAVQRLNEVEACPQFVAQWTGKFVFPEGALAAIGWLELGCVLLYVIPRTAILGVVSLRGTWAEPDARTCR